MAAVIQVFFTIVFIVVCFFLIFIVLLRKSDSSGLGGAFGMGGDSPFGVKTQNALDKLAVFAAIAFFVLAVFLGLFPKWTKSSSRQGGSEQTSSESRE